MTSLSCSAAREHAGRDVGHVGRGEDLPHLVGEHLHAEPGDEAGHHGPREEVGEEREPEDPEGEEQQPAEQGQGEGVLQAHRVAGHGEGDQGGADQPGHRGKRAMSMDSSGPNPKITRVLFVTQNTPVSASSVQRPASAESAARLTRSSASRSASSARLRARALVKTCATRPSRCTNRGGQARSATMVLKARAPTGGSPPTASGRVRFDLMPAWLANSLFTAASGGSWSSEAQMTGRPANICATVQGYWSRTARAPDSFGARRMRVRGRQDLTIGAGPLPEHGEVEAEQVTLAEGRPRFLWVDVRGRQVDEPRGQVCDERLEIPDGPRGDPPTAEVGSTGPRPSIPAPRGRGPPRPAIWTSWMTGSMIYP